MSARPYLVLTFALLLGCGDNDVPGQLPDAQPQADAPPGTDRDGDTIADPDDNCVDVPNTDQLDTDGDGQGDVCDDDDDGDSVLDPTDNCPLDANTDQADADGDSLGDVCDPDRDGDERPNGTDNCPDLANFDQFDLDADGIGDPCDPDDDNDTVADAADNCPTVANTTQLDADMDSHGDACDGVLVPSVSGFLVGGNMTSAGASMAGRTSAAVTQANITLAGIPATATVRQAFLYWTVIGAAHPTLVLDGTMVTGVELATTPDTCWARGLNFIYRADVTSRVAGNGTYALTGLQSAFTGPDGQGASLVVIYTDSADTRTNFIAINDGGSLLLSSMASTVLSGFMIPMGLDKATMTNLVADGQSFNDRMTIAGTVFGGTNAFPGATGPLWDNRVDDVTAAMTVGATSITTVIDGQSDCLAWSMNGVVLEDLGAPVMTPRQPVRALSSQGTPPRPTGTRGGVGN